MSAGCWLWRAPLLLALFSARSLLLVRLRLLRAGERNTIHARRPFLSSFTPARRFSSLPLPGPRIKSLFAMNKSGY